MKRYNLSKLMHKAWSIHRKTASTFSEALKAAWAWIRVQTKNTAKVDATATALNIEEEYHTWAGWQALGRMVMHTETATFKVTVDDPLAKKGTRVKSFFLFSQTQATPMA